MRSREQHSSDLSLKANPKCHHKELASGLDGWDEAEMGGRSCVTMWLSHVSVTMSPICSHVTYHGEITQLGFGVPSDDERRGDWGGRTITFYAFVQTRPGQAAGAGGWPGLAPAEAGRDRSSISCQCPVSLRPGDTSSWHKHHTHRDRDMAWREVVAWTRRKVDKVILSALYSVPHDSGVSLEPEDELPLWLRILAGPAAGSAQHPAHLPWGPRHTCRWAESEKCQHHDVFMIHNSSGMQKLAIKIFEAVQIINVLVKYVWLKNKN